MKRVPFYLGLAILSVMFACAAFPEALSPYDPLVFDFVALQAPPSAAHWFGTDQFGRDVLSRTISAARIDLVIAFCGVIFPLLIGAAIGLITGWYGGWVDAFFGRLMDLVATFPFLVLVITFVAVLGPGLVNMFIALACVGWVSYARLMRGEVLVQKSADYVAAGRVLGYSGARILLRHILPNAFRPVIAFAITDMALVILLGSSLGYLGMGAQPPMPEWGVLIADGKNFMTTAPWIGLSPGVVIVLAGLGFSLTGDGLADLLEVKR